MVTSIFSLSHNVLYSPQNNFQFFSNVDFILSSTNAFNLALENTVRKGGNAGSQYFLLFPQCFLLC